MMSKKQVKDFKTTELRLHGVSDDRLVAEGLHCCSEHTRAHRYRVGPGLEASLRKARNHKEK